MSQPTTEDLQQTREQLREELREARGTLKDLHHEIKTARELIASAKNLAKALAEDTVRAVIETEVTAQVEALGKVTKQQMDKSCAKVISEFDKFRDLLLGNERAPDAHEQRSIPELLQDPEILARAQHHARSNREAGRG
jgi:chromosome segregation ATPase